MNHLKLTDLRFDVEALKEQLHRDPEIWNQIPYRTRFYSQSPHREVDDIWVRYNPLKEFNGDWEKFNSQHRSIWYPVVERVPAARLLSLELLAALGGGELGGVLITRIPPGCQVYPHVDGGWHAGYYEKFIIQVASAPGQKFCFESEELDARPGECYWFDNSAPHWVENPTDQTRISLIICLRRLSCH